MVIAYAAEAKEVAPGIESIPLTSIRWVAGVAFCFGSVATIIKVAKGGVKNLPMEIAKDLAASVAAGILIFAFASMIGLSMWPQFISVMLAGFGGTQVLEVALAKGFFPWLNNVLGRISGTPAGKDTSTPP